MSVYDIVSIFKLDGDCSLRIYDVGCPDCCLLAYDNVKEWHVLDPDVKGFSDAFFDCVMDAEVVRLGLCCDCFVILVEGLLSCPN